MVVPAWSIGSTGLLALRLSVIPSLLSTEKVGSVLWTMSVMDPWSDNVCFSEMFCETQIILVTTTDILYCEIQII
jgi:hypothetical protein